MGSTRRAREQENQGKARNRSVSERKNAQGLENSGRRGLILTNNWYLVVSTFRYDTPHFSNPKIMKHLVGLLVSLMALFSCNEFGNPLEPIEGTLMLEMVEEQSARTGSWDLFFQVETSEDFPCSNYGMVSSAKKKNETIKITLQGTQEPEACMGSSGPAKAVMGFGRLENGTYEITFTHEGRKEVGLLIVQTDEYELKFDANGLIEISNSILVKK
jgi:hypothetical protein